MKHAPEWSGTAADFVKCTEETFDEWIPPTDNKREARPAPPSTIPTWTQRTTNQILAWSLIMGREHAEERTKARDLLLALNERKPHRYTPEWVFNTWEELWWRWGEELKICLQGMLREMGTENPTKEDLRFFALAPVMMI